MIGMDKRTRQALADNLDALMKHRGYTQPQLSKKSGVSQRSICDFLRPDAGNPTISSLEKIAEVFEVSVWELLIPGISLETLLDHTAEKLVDRYGIAGTDGRQQILRIAEAEARYATMKNADEPLPDKVSEPRVPHPRHDKTGQSSTTKKAK